MAIARTARTTGWSLPEGRAGQAGALALTALAGLLLWFGIVAPVLSWYQARNRTIAATSDLLAHERALIASLPHLRSKVAALHEQGSGVAVLLAGRSDAVAGARLQSKVQHLAQQSGITLDSAESMTGVPTGAFRRIPLRVTMTTSYDRLMALLGAIAQAQPRMLVDDLSIHGTGVPDTARDLPVRAAFTVSAFRIGAARAGVR